MILILCVLSSFSLTNFIIPIIIRFCLNNKIGAIPSYRSSHKELTPNLGGIAFFLSIIIINYIFLGLYKYDNSIYMLLSIFIIFLFGLIDDLINISPRSKIYSQFLSATILIFSIGRIDSFYGLFGIYDLNVIVSVIFTYIVIISIVNSFNLIDGIDGLASFVAIIIFTNFAYIFNSYNEKNMVFICVSLLGSLLGFLKYNLSNCKKIFMGDTGSMLLGIIISIMCIILLKTKECNNSLCYNFTDKIPVILLYILSIPINDTIYVIINRCLRRKNIFKPDKNHIHHIFLYLGGSHLKTSLILSFINILYILLCYMLLNIEINKLFFIFVFFTIIITIILNSYLFFYKKKYHRNTKL